MREVSIYQAKTTLSSLLQAVERGEDVVITNRNRPVARIVPFEKKPRREKPGFGSSRDAFERSGLTWEDIDRALAPMSDEELKAWGIL